MPKFCRQCGRPTNPAARFCPACGLDMQQQSAVLPQLLAAQTSQQEPVHQEKKRKKLAFVLIALLVVFSLVAGILFIPPLIQAHQFDKLLKDATKETYTGQIPVSGQPAFTVTPVAGISISCEENALDKKRRFKAKLMTDQELFDYSELHPAEDMVHLAAFTLDASMKPGERFDQPITLKLELDKLGIAEMVAGSGRIILCHIRADSVEEEIPCQVAKGVLTAQIISNGLFILKGVLLGAAAIRRVLISRKFFNIVLNKDTIFNYFYLGNTFKIYWPAALPPANPVEVEALEQRISAVYQAFGIDL